MESRIPRSMLSKVGNFSRQTSTAWRSFAISTWFLTHSDDCFSCPRPPYNTLSSLRNFVELMQEWNDCSMSTLFKDIAWIFERRATTISSRFHGQQRNSGGFKEIPKFTNKYSQPLTNGAHYFCMKFLENSWNFETFFQGPGKLLEKQIISLYCSGKLLEFWNFLPGP